MAHARAAFDLSERRACAILGFDRTSVRYRSSRGGDADLRGRLRALAGERRRFGWRRLMILLAREGITPNHKKPRRVYAEGRLQVRRRGGRSMTPVSVEYCRRARGHLAAIGSPLAQGALPESTEPAAPTGSHKTSWPTALTGQGDKQHRAFAAAARGMDGSALPRCRQRQDPTRHHRSNRPCACKEPAGCFAPSPALRRRDCLSLAGAARDGGQDEPPRMVRACDSLCRSSRAAFPRISALLVVAAHRCSPIRL